MHESAILVQVDKWVGVVIALVGSVVVAPDGTRLLLHSLRAWLTRQGTRAWSTLARALPFLPRNTTAHAHTAHGSMGGVLGALVATATGWAWTPTAPVDERIEALRQHLTAVEGQLHRVEQDLRRERSDRDAAISELHQALRADLDELRGLLQRKDQETAAIDARGLPVIGLGILLSGVPEALSRIPWHLGWLMPILGMTAAAAAIAHAVRVRRSSDEVVRATG